ncbi:MAG: DUF1631 domain-containing protein [Rubrivivax sp.]|nr:DUF1631 domain-containing protein [Rubrivivax sp.]
MKPNPVHRLPATLEAAVQRLKLAAREAADRTIESLGLAALAATHAFQRDGLLGAQFELNRKSAVFVLTFNDAFDERVVRELVPRVASGHTGVGNLGGLGGFGSSVGPGSAITHPAPLTSWDALSLVEDREVEAQISAERFGMEIAHACEWELRELDAYVATVLTEAGGERERNPLRPEIVGQAMIRGIEAVSDRADVRKVLSSELSRSLSALLRSTYPAIVADFRNAGVKRVGLTVRQRSGGVGGGAGGGSGGGGGGGDSSRGGAGGDSLYGVDGGTGSAGGPGAPGGDGGFNLGPLADSRVRRAGVMASQSGHGSSGLIGHGGSAGHGGFGSTRGTMLGNVDPGLMSLIRRLAYADLVASSGAGGAFGPSGAGAMGVAESAAYGNAGSSDGLGTYADPGMYGDHGEALAGAQRLPLPNLIHAHRDELRQASRGSVDHMVIDVISFLFDQILADPKVPPQMARQLARLQLPVLRAALGDPSFFSSRRHPVRRFVNRIASLGTAFEDFNELAAKNVLGKVRALVQEVVEGDFDQIEVYQHKLAALETFVAQQAGQELQGEGGAAELLAQKEDELRLRQMYADRLAGELKDLSAPQFVRDFISRVWSQVLLRAASLGSADGAQAQRLRMAGRELALSVHPKPTPAHRKAFLAGLPALMRELTEGMNLIGWPEGQRREFFGQLMPAHAEALRSAGGRQLDLNLMARQVEGALQRPLPSRDELRQQSALPVLSDEVELPALTAEEAQRVGLVEESAVDWDGKVDIEIGADSDADSRAAGDPADAADAAGRPLRPEPALPGLPAMTEAPEATHGRELADNIQIGFAYQMHLNDSWQKVRLSHVSPGRSFFLFTQGSRHKKTVSLTQRMLLRLCETGRLRAFENSALLERATERARRQLAALAVGSRSTRY